LPVIDSSIVVTKQLCPVTMVMMHGYAEGTAV